MNYQTSFSRFGGGGGPNRPNMTKQLFFVFGAWLIAKICITKPRGSGDSGIAYKYTKPRFVAH